MKCKMSVPPNGDSCPADATCLVVWPDGDKTPACLECLMRTKQVAESHRTTVRVEALVQCQPSVDNR
jgi:hypothetical protein